MIDKITLIKNNLTTYEKLQVIEKNNLQSFINESNGSRIYDNQKTKNLTGGILIKITNESLKVEGSVHKYFNFLQYGNLENFTVFTMQNFTETIEILYKNFALPNTGYLLKTFEIGLNIFLETGEPLDYLKKVKSIGNLDGTQRKIYINPKYKNERFLCTQMHKDNTLIFRIYDKNHERKDKGKKSKIPNCIRIETLRTRQKNVEFSEFCRPQNLAILQNKFFSEWNKLNFNKEVTAPKNTHQVKKDRAKKIILHGVNSALLELEEKRNQLTQKIFRNSKDFIKNWENNKQNFALIDCEIMPFWANAYTSAIQLVTNFSNKK